MSSAEPLTAEQAWKDALQAGRKICDVIAQRDQLAEALRMALEHDEAPSLQAWAEFRDAATAALARLEGK